MLSLRYHTHTLVPIFPFSDSGDLVQEEQLEVTSGVLLVTLFTCVIVAVGFPVMGPRQSLDRVASDELGVFSAELALYLEASLLALDPILERSNECRPLIRELC